MIRNAPSRTATSPCLDPLNGDIDDPTKLRLRWYGMPLFSDVVSAYSQRIRIAVYMKYPNLCFRIGDFYRYGVRFEDRFQSTNTRTSFNNHEIPLATGPFFHVHRCMERTIVSAR